MYQEFTTQLLMLFLAFIGKHRYWLVRCSHLSLHSSQGLKNWAFSKGLSDPRWQRQSSALRNSLADGLFTIKRDWGWPPFPPARWQTFVCWLIGFAGFWQRQVCKDPFLATAFVLELQLWQPITASPITWFKELGRWTSHAYQLYIRTPSESLAQLSSQLSSLRLSGQLLCWTSHPALVVSSFRNCYFSGLPHLQQDLAVSGSNTRATDLTCLFNGLFVAYCPWLGQCPAYCIPSRGSDRCFAASFFPAGCLHFSHVSLDHAHGQLVPSLCWTCFMQVVGT